MQVPEEFEHLAHCFYQGSSEEVSTAREWVALALSHLQNGQRAVVSQFLHDLLSENPDGTELQRIWNNTGPDYGFSDDEHLREFLILIRDMAAPV